MAVAADCEVEVVVADWSTVRAWAPHVERAHQMAG